jgi:PAS domain S-box-containing protein
MPDARPDPYTGPPQDPARFGLGRLFWTTSEAIVGADLPSGRIVLWNPTAHALFGYPPEEAVGMPLERLVPTSLRDRHLAGIARYRGHGAPVLVGGPPTEVPAVTRDGQPLDVALSLTDVTDEREGQPRRQVLAVIRDVTAVRRAERRLQATLEAMNEFVASAAHDLRNPLTVISGFTSLLLDSSDRLPASERREMLQRIAHSSAHAARLVDDLMTSSQIEAGAIDVAPEPVAVAEAVRHAIERSGTDATAQLDLDALVRVDPHHLERMLVNLLANARAHGRPPITVTVRAERSEVSIEVQDCGDGVPEDFLPRLFARFSRADTSRRDGTGLGLSIVQGLAEANGGSISYRREGLTSCFTLHLPPAPAG